MEKNTELSPLSNNATATETDETESAVVAEQHDGASKVAAKTGSGSPNQFLKMVVGVLCLLIVGGGIAGAYLFGKRMAAPPTAASPSPVVVVASPEAAVTEKATISGWKTYTNTKYSFSIDYPDTWRFRESPDTMDSAGFSPLSSKDEPGMASIVVAAGLRIGDQAAVFEDYVKVAATQEIQNYESLASIKEVVTNDGVTGFITTWMVSPFLGRGSGNTESLPITYFDYPYRLPSTVQVRLENQDDLAVYQQMIKTYRFFGKVPNPSIDDSQLIKEALYKANNWGEDIDVTLTMKSNDGTYANGLAGGGYFFAVKINGTWKIVAAGNGVITCASLADYPDYPTLLIPECYDEATEQVVKR